MWTIGLFMTLWVGPAQSASRSFLARRIPEGHEGEVFGLYQTTGRSVTWLAPLMFTLFISLGQQFTPFIPPALLSVTTGPGGPMMAIHAQAQYWGILGIGLVLLLGLLMLLPVREDHTVLKRAPQEAPEVSVPAAVSGDPTSLEGDVSVTVSPSGPGQPVELPAKTPTEDSSPETPPPSTQPPTQTLGGAQ